MRGMRMLRAGMFVVQAVAVGVLLVVTDVSVDGPVIARLVGEDVTIATVHLGWATVVVLVAGALVDGGIALAPALRRHERLVTWVGWSQVSAISVFLVAQLNGITELTTLVALYAITAGAALLLALDGATADTGARGLRRPAALAAVIGIVPWGLIAFAQIGGGVVGQPVGIVVRVVTLAVLALAIAVWFRAWHRPAADDPPGILPLLSASVLAWGVVAAGLG